MMKSLAMTKITRPALQKRHVMLMARVVFIALALTWVFSRLDMGQVMKLIQHSNPWMLAAAICSFLLAQLVSGLRTRYYFAQAGLKLSRKFSIATHLVAALYNLILPGGMGGDGYKVFLIGKLSHLSYRHATRIAISERANGLFILLLLAIALAFYTGLAQQFSRGILLLSSGFMLLPLAYLVSIKLLLKETPTTAFGAMRYSLIVQLGGVICVLLLLQGLGIWQQGLQMSLHYVLLFLIAAIVNMVPLTIGGVGLRELTFFYGAVWLGTDAETGVTLALLFFLTTLTVAMTGSFFTHKLVAYYGEGNDQ